jgi:cephalosporin-C deacetylase-like acetyl esterase
VKYIDPRDIPKAATDPLPALPHDLRALEPVSDQLFRAYRSMYSYDRTPLNAPIQRLDSTNEDWTTEKVSYTAAYGDEQASAYLLLPKKSKRPLQSVLYFPGDGALFLRYRCLLLLSWMPFCAADEQCSIRCTRALMNVLTAPKGQRRL